MMNIYYENSRCERLDLLSPPYLLQTGDIFDYTRPYESVETSTGGGKITAFVDEIIQKSLTLSVVNYGKESYEAAINRFFDIVEFDVLNGNPGKLYVGGQYIKCYVTESKKAEWEREASYLDNEITLTVEYPFWITESFFNYRKSDSPEAGSPFLDYSYDYLYDYLGSIKGVGYLLNDWVSSVHFKMVVYGPCLNPRILISGQLYEVSTRLDEGEYLMIESRQGTVTRVKTDGRKANEFDSCNKEYSVFEKILAGNNLVSWDGAFGFDITIYKERREPEWS